MFHRWSTPQQKTSSRKEHPSTLLIVVSHILKQLRSLAQVEQPCPTPLGNPGYVPPLSLKDSWLISDQPSISIGHISLHLWRQTAISRHSICPVHCFPSWQRPIVAGSGQSGPGGAECSLPRVPRPGQGCPGPRGVRTEPAPLSCGEHPGPGQGAVRPARHCCELTGMALEG